MTGMRESVDRRVLGGFSFVDAITSIVITVPLTVTSQQLQVKRNYSGVYAIFDGPGFHGHTGEFIPAGDWGPVQLFEIAVRDPSLRYLPRRAQVQAPQKLVAGTFAIQQVLLYPTPSSPVELNWAVVRAVVVSTSGTPLPWSAVEVLLIDKSVAAKGVADERGQALLAVPGMGIQVTSHATDPVTEATTAVTVQAWFDPGVLKQPAGWAPNPDDILGNLTNPALKTNTQNGALGARETLFATITISV